MYQRIFVPIDASEASNKALAEAIKLAKPLGATLILAHSIQAPKFGADSQAMLNTEEIEKSLNDSAVSVLQIAAASVREAGLAVEECIEPYTGEPVAATLLAAAERTRADLIVMGKHGHTGIMHLMVGGVAEGMLRAATLPIMLVHSEVHHLGHKK
jgi:nucleotide-binding universal stress UspA family protein